MTQPLFREAAVAHQGERLWGELILTQPLPVRLVGLFLAALTLVAGCWLVTNSYQRKVTVSGQLVPDSGVLELPAPATGTVDQLLVKLDQQVVAGTPLFAMALDHTLHSAQALSTELLASLEQQAAVRQQQMALEQHNLQRSAGRFAAALALAMASIQQWEQLQSEQQQLLDIRHRQALRGQQLQQQGLLAAADQDQLEAQLLQQQQALGQATIQLQQAQAAAARLRQEHDSDQLRGEQQLQGLQTELLQLDQQRLRQRGEQQTVVTAPVAGQISNIHLSAGMAVRQQQPVLR
jgi:membrane fusion protein